MTGNQQEILWFCQALAYLEDRPELRALIRRVEDHGIAINLDQESPSELFRRWREIRWNPTLAQEIEGGRVLSPALALWHELVHADGYLRFPDRYDQRRDTPKQAHKNWEEARAIAAERDAAGCLASTQDTIIMAGRMSACPAPSFTRHCRRLWQVLRGVSQPTRRRPSTGQACRFHLDRSGS